MKLDLPIRAAAHTDPVTHETSVILRKATNHQTSQRLKNFQKCVRTRLQGHSHRGGSAVQNSLAVRADLTAAAKACAGGRG